MKNQIKFPRMSSAAKERVKNQPRISGKFTTVEQVQREAVKQDLIKDLPPTIEPFADIPNAFTFSGISGSPTGIPGVRVLYDVDAALRESRESARKMRLDALVMGCLKNRQLATAALDHTILVDDENDPVQRQVAHELNYIIDRFPRWQNFKMSLLEGIWFGASATNLRYVWKPFPAGKLTPQDGKIAMMPIDWRSIHGDKLAWTSQGQLGVKINRAATTDEDILVTTQQGAAKLLTPKELESLVLYQHETYDGEYEDPWTPQAQYKIGLRHYLFWYYYLRNQTFRWLNDALERFGSPWILYFFEIGNPTSKQAAIDTAKENRDSQTNILLVPKTPDPNRKDTSGIEIVYPESSGFDSLMNIIKDYYDTIICKFIMGHSLIQDVEPTGIGSEGISALATNAFARIIKYDKSNLEESLTSMIRVMFEYNYPHLFGKFDVRLKLNLEKPDPEKFMLGVEKASALGIEVDADQIREVLGLSKPEEGDDVATSEEITVDGDDPKVEPDDLEGNAASAQESLEASGLAATVGAFTQVSQLVSKVRTGELSRENAKQMMIAFLGFTSDVAEAILADAGVSASAPQT